MRFGLYWRQVFGRDDQRVPTFFAVEIKGGQTIRAAGNIQKPDETLKRNLEITHRFFRLFHSYDSRASRELDCRRDAGLRKLLPGDDDLQARHDIAQDVVAK